MEIFEVFKHALIISYFVFIMMLLVDFMDTASRKRLTNVFKGGRWRQYTLASFLGSTPGCLGAFMDVSLYVHGIISFGAIVGGMIATSGDEAFVMLAKFPGTALLLFASLFVSGILFAWISDKIIDIIGYRPCKPCLEADCDHCDFEMNGSSPIQNKFHPANIFENFKNLSFTRFLILALIASFLLLVFLGTLGPAIWNWKRVTFISLSFCALFICSVTTEHYLHYHIWDHIIKSHLFRIFLWSFGALLFVHEGLTFWNLDAFIHHHMFWVLSISALLGIIPESGPHLIFVMMYAQGLVPFSVLFTASFVQDGHGMIPMLSYSLKDSVLIKVFNLVFGFIVGSILFAIGI